MYLVYLVQYITSMTICLRNDVINAFVSTRRGFKSRKKISRAFFFSAKPIRVMLASILRTAPSLVYKVLNLSKISFKKGAIRKFEYVFERKNDANCGLSFCVTPRG